MKHLLLSLMILFLASNAEAKTVYARAGGGNWSTDATWSTSSGGGADTTKPIAGDTVYLDANSGQVTVDVASACAIIDCTGYTNTLTQSAGMTTTGNVTFVAGMTFTPNTQTWTFSGGTLIPAGKTFYDININNATVTLSTTDLTVSHNLLLTGSSAILTGRTVTMTGGTWSNSSGATGQMQSNLTFNGNCTVGTSTNWDVYFNTGTLTYTSGTITTTSSRLIVNGNTTLNTNGMTWNNMTGGSVSTIITLSSDLTLAGSFLLSTNSITFSGGTRTVTVGGSVSCHSLKGGNAITLVMTGTGTLTQVNDSGARIAVNLTFNAPGQTITLNNSNFRWGDDITSTSCTVKWVAGTISYGASTAWGIRRAGYYDLQDTCIGDLFTYNASATLLSNAKAANFVAGSGYQWICSTYSVTVLGNFTNSAGTTNWKTGNNTFIFDGTSTLTGATNFYNVTINPGKTVTLTSGTTFAVTNTFSAPGTSASHITMNSTTPTSVGHWDPSGNTAVAYVDATDIDSATGGFTITTTGGSITRTVNWAYVAPPPSTFPSIIKNAILRNCIIR
jgi:hypothetical protein